MHLPLNGFDVADLRISRDLLDQLLLAEVAGGCGLGGEQVPGELQDEPDLDPERFTVDFAEEPAPLPWALPEFLIPDAV